MSVWAEDKIAWIRIEGRANFNSSVDFKALINGLVEKGYCRFVLDLTECVLMDSTFLGVLAGLGLKFNSSRNGAPTIELLNANERIADLLENLGVEHLFKLVSGPELSSNRLQKRSWPSIPITYRSSKKSRSFSLRILKRWSSRSRVENSSGNLSRSETFFGFGLSSLPRAVKSARDDQPGRPQSAATPCG